MGISKPSQSCVKHQKDMAVLYSTHNAKFSGRFVGAPRRKTGPVEALQGRNELQLLVMCVHLHLRLYMTVDWQHL